MSIKVATDETFQQVVIESDKPVVVDFWAAWCGPCKLVAPELEKLAEKYEGRLDVVKVDVDANPASRRHSTSCPSRPSPISSPALSRRAWPVPAHGELRIGLRPDGAPERPGARGRHGRLTGAQPSGLTRSSSHQAPDRQRSGPDDPGASTTRTDLDRRRLVRLSDPESRPPPARRELNQARSGPRKAVEGRRRGSDPLAREVTGWLQRPRCGSRDIRSEPELRRPSLDLGDIESPIA
jgi:hypothetical protein